MAAHEYQGLALCLREMREGGATMNPQEIVGNRWTILYDKAATEFAEACKARRVPDQHGWMRRLKWLDGKLREDMWEW